MAEASSRLHQCTTPDGHVADGVRITTRLDPKRMDLRNLAAPCSLPSDRETCTLAAGPSAATNPGPASCGNARTRCPEAAHEHTGRFLDPVTGRTEEIGCRSKLEQLADSIELTIYTIIYGGTRINNEFREYRIMKWPLIFRVHRSR